MTNKKKDCIFCKIASGEAGENLILDDENFVVFNDVNPASD